MNCTLNYDRECLKVLDTFRFVREENRVLLVRIKTLKDLRGAVSSKGKALFATERSRAKSAVARRVREETE